MTLIFNPVTKTHLAALSKNLPQGVLITGEDGAGLLTTAHYLAGNAIAAIIKPLTKDGTEEPKNGTIGVARIRQLYSESRGKSVHARVFIIDDADRMTKAAQNAFLKLLEEPSPATHFILTSHRPSELLPTVRSRVETVRILPISASQTKDMLARLKVSPSVAAQLAFVATGKPAELIRLSTDEKKFAVKIALMTDAKEFLSGNKLERIGVAFRYAGSRESALKLLESSLTIVKASMTRNPTKATIGKAETLSIAYAAIKANGNTRLQLVATVV